MAHFRGTVRGDRGEASRQGGRSSGLHAKSLAKALRGSLEGKR